MKHGILLILLLGTALSGDDKSAIDRIVGNILEPRHVGESLVQKSPFVDGDRPRSKPVAQAKKSTPRVELQGIVNKKALINNRLYQVGDRVEGYQVLTISEEGITLLKNGILYAAKLAAGGSEIHIKRDK